MRKLLLSLVTIVFATSLFAKDISVGYVLVGPSNDGGWSMRHSDGFKSLVKHGYEVEGVESVPEADSERVFKKLARKHDIVLKHHLVTWSPWFVHPQRTRRRSSCTPQDTRVMTQTWTITCVTPFKQDTSQVLQPV